MVILKKYRLLIISTLVALIFSSPSLYFYFKLQEAQKKLSQKVLPAQDQTQQIIDKVGKLIDLPKDETPTIATITDKEKLASQPFFANAKNGDKVLIYTNARKAILYDPVADKIVDVAPLNISSPSAQTEGATSPTPQTISLLLYNGTDINGLTRKYESEIKQKIGSFTVVDRDNAQKRDYQKTILIDLGNDQQDQAQNLANQLGIATSSLPPEETASASADFLIIVGQDKK